MSEAVSGGAASREARDAGRRSVPGFSRPEVANIVPYLIVDGAPRLIDFLKAAFGGEELLRVSRPDGSMMHAEVRIGNSVIEMSDAIQAYPAAPGTVHLYVDDAEADYRRALDDGATSLYPVGKHPSGDLQGCVRDAFGNVWYIAKVQGWDPGPGGPLSVQPYLHLRNAEKMIPFAEKAFRAQTHGVTWSDDRQVLHATIQVEHATFEIDEASAEWPAMPCHLHMYVRDVDACYADALAAGATAVDPPTDREYGERSAGLKDPFGNTWYVATYRG